MRGTELGSSEAGELYRLQVPFHAFFIRREADLFVAHARGDAKGELDAAAKPSFPRLYFDTESQMFRAHIELPNGFKLAETFPVVRGGYVAARSAALSWLQQTKKILNGPA
eukprot:Blabericola_migrator_1__2890@NODE_182_length_11861_cov_167_496185_g158_i0_p13_GENE_NODE_182_length_11861_cov_167_496185_g158_i0NODE_182_length_11861_cov_167_496185_g158_i0_p13_ORF_typecomplete_len111_score11_86_NODE_182_length_11861_cov_167_496185_g158_i080368368